MNYDRAMLAIRITIRVTWLIFTCLYKGSAKVMAQPPNSIHYTVENGLPSSLVYRIFQDSEGLIWICTDQGVVRFDSQHFERFTTREGLPCNDNWGIMEDRQHRVWFMSYSTAFAYYDMNDRKIHSISNTLTGQNHELTWGLIDAGNKGTFVLLSKGGKLFLKPDGHVFSLTNETKPSIADLSRQVPILVKQPGAFFFQSIYDNIDFFAGVQPALLSKEWQNHSTDILTILFYPNQTVFAKEQELTLYNGHDIHVKRLRELSNHIDDRLVRLSRTGVSNLILVVTRKGQFIIDQQLNRRHEFDFIDHLNVNSVLIDREDNLWIATKDQGVIVIRRKALNVANVNELREKAVSVITKTYEGTMWFGTVSGEVFWRDKKGLHRLPLSHVYPAAVKSINCLGKSHLLICWSSIYHAVIPLSLLKKKQISLFEINLLKNAQAPFKIKLRPEDAYLFSWQTVKDVCQAGARSMCIAASSQIYQLSLQDKYYRLTPLVSTQRTFALTIDKQNTLWAGMAMGLQPYNIRRAGSTGTEPIRKLYTKPFLLGPVYDLIIDRHDALWAGTDGAGLLRLANGKIATVGQTRGLTIKGLYYASATDHLYAATNQGVLVVQIIQMNPFKYSFKRISVESGLPSQEINSVYEEKDTLYIATNRGVSKLQISDKNPLGKLVRAKLPVWISTLHINGRSMPIRNHYELSHDQNNIKLEFVAPVFGSNLPTNYEYCFFNLSKPSSIWHPLNQGRTKEFTELNPGGYQFNLRAINPDRTLNLESTSLLFVIHPAIWQSNWFLIMLLIVGLGTFIGAAKLYIKWKLNRQQSVLWNVIQIQEEERKRLAADLHDDLGATLSAIKGQLEIITSPNEALIKPIDLMEKAIRDLRHISHNLMPPEFIKLGLTETIRETVRRAEAGSTLQFIFITYGQEHRLANETELTLYRIAIELINNAIKHARAQRITIQLIFYPQYVSLLVEDDGRGYSPQERLTQAGIGLRNIRSRVTYLKSTLLVDSGERGTTVTVDVPF